MNLRNPLFAAVGVVIMSFAVVVWSQGVTDGIKVTLPQPVTLGDQVLDPGEYEIRRASTTTDQVLQIFSNDKMRYQAVVITIPTLGKETPEESKVVLHHIGDKYYFDKIWMEGKTYGYEFVLPEEAKSLQRELALDVPARYEPAPAAPEQVAQVDQQAEAERAAQSARQAEADRATQAERERQAQLERERQAQLERERQAQAERDRIASVQTERGVAPSTPDSRVAQARQDETRDQLPATASNWLAFFVGGVILLTLSALLRPARRQE